MRGFGWFRRGLTTGERSLGPAAADRKRPSSTRGRRLSTRLRHLLAVFLTVTLLASSASVSAQPALAPPGPDDALGGSKPFHSYVVHLGNPTWVVAVTRANQNVDAEIHERERAQISAILDNLAAAGKAGTYAYDDVQNVFRVQLSDAGRAALATNPLVESIEPEVISAAGNPLKNNLSTQSVSSIDYIQVFTPFMWGYVNTGGLSIDIKLFASDGTTQIGVPCQLARTSGPNYVVIDNSVLYFETVFVKPDPSDPTRPDPSVNAGNCTPAVNIMPHDVVQVVTTGNGTSSTNRITVDDIDGWESYRQDTVSGAIYIIEPGSTVWVTTGGLAIGSQYLDPSTYRGFTPSGNGSFGFTVSSWCKLASGAQPSPSCTPTTTVNLNPGATGWIRVEHPGGNEVYTAYGYTLQAFENGTKIRGYDFQLPGPVGGLTAPGVTVPRPPIVETITLNPGGTTLMITGGTPFDTTTPVLISPNSTIQAQINQNPHVITVNVSPLTATINLGTNQVTGVGPPSTPVDLGVNDTDGYMSKSFSAHYVKQTLTTDATTGQFVSNPFTCGQNGVFRLQPGSFGTLGFEDPKGNYVYIGFAAPTADVMTHYPFIEGWVANSTDTATVTLLDSTGTVKDQQTVSPILIYLGAFQLYVNSYFNVTPSQNIAPGDVVTVTAPGVSLRIPVDEIGGQLNADADFISGQAPPGSTVKVIPQKNPTAYFQATVSGNGSFMTGSPFVTTDGGCNQGTWTPVFNIGDGGRIYVLHADGTRVFTYYGRAISVNENERYVELWLYYTHGIDWDNATGRTLTVTLSPAQGTPVVTVASNTGGNGSDYIKLDATKLANWPNVQARDTVTATFTEGPDGGPTQMATINFASIPLLTGSGNLDNSTLGGAAPAPWWGVASLLTVASNPVPIPPRQYAAYGPLQFFSGSNKTPIPLGQGYGGQVSMTDAWNYVATDASTHRVWIAWAITVIPVEIIGYLRPGDTVVCGKGPPNVAINIYDVTNNATGLTIILGSGSTDSTGHFCVTVNAPLYLGQVVMAGTPPPDNNLSQPVVVLNPIFLPIVYR